MSHLLAEYRVSERRACATVFLQRTVYRYLGQRRDDRAVRQRLKELAETRMERDILKKATAYFARESLPGTRS